MEIRRATLWSLGTLFALGAAGAGAEEIYRWVDESGDVHYGNSVPPQYAEQVFGDRHPGADPAAAAEAKRAEADRVLLRTYGSIEEIEKLRDQRLERLRYQDELTRGYLESLRGQLAHYEAEAAESPEQRAALEGRIEETRGKIAAFEQKLADSEARQAKTRADFDASIARYRELTAATDG
jgi:hypothetical protein